MLVSSCSIAIRGGVLGEMQLAIEHLGTAHITRPASAYSSYEMACLGAMSETFFQLTSEAPLG